MSQKPPDTVSKLESTASATDKFVEKLKTDPNHPNDASFTEIHSEAFAAVRDAGMSETQPAPAPTEAPKDELEAMAEGAEATLSIMVRGGTSTYAHDMAEKKRWAEAEARRDMLERYQQIANTPIEKGGGVMYTKQFADPLSSPRVLLRYVNSKKETIYEMLCELVESDSTGDRILQFVCPYCVEHGVHMDAAQCTVRDAHRKWHVDTKNTGEMRQAETVDMRGNKVLEPYIHAGEIMDTEMLVCDRCSTAYKIHRNMLYRYWSK